MVINILTATQSLIIALTIALLKPACAVPCKERYPVNFDISGGIAPCMRVTRSSESPGGMYYYVKKTLSVIYRMGSITNSGISLDPYLSFMHTLHSGQMILPGDSREMERFLFLLHLPNSTRYVRITTKAKYRGGNRRKIMEYITKPNDQKFYQVIRTPINVDISTQNSNHLIQVDENFQGTAKRFRIREEAMYRFSIGMVRFGTFVLNNRAQGLVDRRIMWEGGMEDPFVTIISTFTHGERHTVCYKFLNSEVGFVMESRRITKVFLNPKDEKFVDDFGRSSKDGEDQEEASKLESAASAFVDEDDEEEPTSIAESSANTSPEEQPSTSTHRSRFGGPTLQWPCIPIDDPRFHTVIPVPRTSSIAECMPSLSDISTDGTSPYCVGAPNCIGAYRRADGTVDTQQILEFGARIDGNDYDQRDTEYQHGTFE